MPRGPKKSKIECSVITVPLHWPIGRQRTEPTDRKNAPYRSRNPAGRSLLPEATNALKRQFRAMGVSAATISWDLRESEDAHDASNKTDPGVAIWYTWRTEKMCIASDKWNTIIGNLRAATRGITGVHMLQTSGVANLPAKALINFAAMSPWVAASKEDLNPKEQFLEILELGENCTLEDIERSHRRLCLVYHPDKNRVQEKVRGASFAIICDAKNNAMHYRRFMLESEQEQEFKKQAWEKQQEEAERAAAQAEANVGKRRNTAPPCISKPIEISTDEGDEDEITYEDEIESQINRELEEAYLCDEDPDNQLE